MVDLQRLDAEKLSIDSPILAEQLRNPAFAALAYDDIEHLGNWEIAGHLLYRVKAKINIVMFEGEHEKVKEYLDSVKGEKNINVTKIYAS